MSLCYFNSISKYKHTQVDKYKLFFLFLRNKYKYKWFESNKKEKRKTYKIYSNQSLIKDKI